MASFYKKLIFCSLLIIAMAIFSLALAEETPTDEPTPTPENIEEDISAQDLGVATPNILPDSKFYFLKEWQRNLKLAFTFNSVKKAELRQVILNEKLIELKKLSEKTQDPEVLKKATENYQKGIEKLNSQIQKIKDTAQANPKVNQFLEKFTEQNLLQQRLLRKLENQVPPQVFEKIEAARKSHLGRFGEVMSKLEDRKENISERIDQALEKQKDSDFKSLRDLQILKDLKENLPLEIQEKINTIEEKRMERLKEVYEKMSPEKQEKIGEYLQQIGGDKEKQLEILETLKQEVKSEAIQNKLEQARDKIIEKIEQAPRNNNCPSWTAPTPGFCKEGRVIIEKDEKGCPLSPKCITPGEQLAGLITCCMDSACVRVTKEKCEDAGGKIVGASSCIPNPCEKKVETSPETSTEKPIEKPVEGIACITLWDPVCGKDEKTYSNSCFAKSAGAEIDYKGICKEKIKSVPPAFTEQPSEIKEQEQRGVDVEKVK